MARFFGTVGYGLPSELVDGVWSDNIVERAYYGDILEQARTLSSSDKVNDDFRLAERISVLADAFALENFSHIKYVDRAGSLWSVTSVSVERPRLILTLGGAYHGPTLIDSETP